jgi:hypothetical protein
MFVSFTSVSSVIKLDLFEATWSIINSRFCSKKRIHYLIIFSRVWEESISVKRFGFGDDLRFNRSRPDRVGGIGTRNRVRTGRCSVQVPENRVSVEVVYDHGSADVAVSFAAAETKLVNRLGQLSPMLSNFFLRYCLLRQWARVFVPTKYLQSCVMFESNLSQPFFVLHSRVRY